MEPLNAATAVQGAAGAEAVTLTVALILAGLVFPLAALVFAAANLRRGSEAQLLFLSALVSSGLSLLAGLSVALLPGAGLDGTLGRDWRGFALVFLYAWALLDFWRGARTTGARPRGPAIVAGLSLASMVLGFVMVAT